MSKLDFIHFKIGVFGNGAWIAVREPDFFGYAGLTDILKSLEKI